MKIQNILCTKGAHVVTISAEGSIRDAVAMLVRYHIGALVVLNTASELVGILSERDIIRAAATNEALFSLTVADLMTRELIVGTPDSDVAAVAHTMTEKRIRHVPVLDHGELVGLVSIGDVVKAQRDAYEGELYTLQIQVLGTVS